MYKLFRTKMENSSNCSAKYEASFIVEGTSAVDIFAVRLNVNKKAALILTEKEGPDTGIVYTYKERNTVNELLKSDYFLWKDNTYFVYEDIDLVREGNYKKQRFYQCNVKFKCGVSCYGGYFVSSLAKYVDTSLQQNLVITGNEKPILICPYFNWVAIGQQLEFGGKTWKIIDFDLITNDGIAYMSLDRDFDRTFDDVVVEDEVKEGDIVAGTEHTMDLNFGYFKADAEVEVVRKTAYSITFIVPYGLSEITITTKDTDKNDVITTYKVVI